MRYFPFPFAGVAVHFCLLHCALIATATWPALDTSLDGTKSHTVDALLALLLFDDYPCLLKECNEELGLELKLELKLLSTMQQDGLRGEE